MSGPRFASVTGLLLARKGEAGPSSDRLADSARWQKPSPPPALVVKAATPVNDAKLDVKIALRLTDAQHFRMRVAAAQMQVTRQALLSAALDHYLATVCAASVPGCHCLTSGQGCGCASM